MTDEDWPSGQTGQDTGARRGHPEAGSMSEARAGPERKLWRERSTAQSSSLNRAACFTVLCRPEMRMRPRPWDSLYDSLVTA